jgi:hypothetical protein
MCERGRAYSKCGRYLSLDKLHHIIIFIRIHLGDGLEEGFLGGLGHDLRDYLKRFHGFEITIILPYQLRITAV